MAHLRKALQQPVQLQAERIRQSKTKRFKPQPGRAVRRRNIGQQPPGERVVALSEGALDGLDPARADFPVDDRVKRRRLGVSPLDEL